MTTTPDALAGAGTVVAITGASSTGKTSIAARLRLTLPRPTVFLPGDSLDLPPGSRSLDVLRSLPTGVAVTLGRRYHAGYFEALASFAASGLHAIGEVLFKEPATFAAFEEATAHVPALVVHVRCGEAVRRERERRRSDRGAGTADVTAAQEWVPPRVDLLIDSTAMRVEDAARLVADALG